MEKTCFLLLPLTMLLVCSFINVASLALTVTNITTDQSALLALKSHITFDPGHVLVNNWTADNSVCDWVGVICNTRHKRVAALDLGVMGLMGTFPPHLGNLSFLVRLSIPNNSFHGDLPKELAHLRRLKFLSVAFNNFGGQIPSRLVALPKLQFLSLRNNNFTGTIPSFLFNCSKLETLELSYNLLEGKIPVEIGNLSNLKWLSLSFNQLTSSIPLSIFNISSLQNMDFSGNGLSGNIPANMCYRLPKLEILSLSLNELEGQIPSTLQGCSKLQILSLSINKFTGPVPSEIGNLTMLKELYLGANNLKDEIPQELGQLKVLEVLSMAEAGLTGLVPSIIFNISSLKLIGIGNNSLSGGLPVDMCLHLPLLQVLYLYNNKFTGSLPSSIGNCTLLKELVLTSNKLAGSIPREIGEIHSLVWLDISTNSLSGPIPSNIFNISTLEVIFLAENRLSGHLPSTIGGWMPNIVELLLGGNELTGVIPDSISNASKLIALSLVSNSFTGLVPNTLGSLESIQLLNLQNNNLTTNKSTCFLASLTKCRNLRKLALSSNRLNVILPVTIGNLSSLQYFLVDNCKIMGNIPREIGNLSHLLIIDLGVNDLSGAIPATFGQLSNLQYLYLGGNQLQGSIPNNLCDLRDLAYLFLGPNKFFGSLPTCFGNLTSLRKLLVDSCGLTSAIPVTLWNLKDLLILNLSSNSLSGVLPLEIGNLKVVTQIDLSRNQLSGKIPTSIGSLQNLLTLSLAHNRFQGPIPQSFGSLISLEFLDLSQNNLSGIIPKFLEQLSYLKYLNFSSNNLEGEIPEGGPFANFTPPSFMWNKALCGVARFQVRPCTRNHHRSRETMMLIGKCILPITASVVLMLVCIFVFTRCQKRERRILNQESIFPGRAPKRFSHQELQQSTNGFGERNILGTGSFASVYKGTFSDGLIAAIKVFDLQLEGSLRSFDIECEVMRNLRHRNLIKVIGSCSNLDFKALVVEYMPNGTLEKWLYNSNHCLDILQRINMLIDVASALEYLHHDYSTPVVHCDVKPSNVLLNEDLVAHLGDYGIAKLFGKHQSIAQTKTMATIGYIAPEYGSKGIVSTKGDVYSFGIMMLETFTRKKPTDEIFVGEKSLKHWVNESLPHAIIEVVDTSMLRREDEYFNDKEHCVKSIMELSLSCCRELPVERVNMKDVLTTLKKIKDEFLTNIQS